MHRRVSTPEFRSRFEAKVSVRGPQECWPWTGATAFGGYGYIWVVRQTKSERAHRLAYFFENGEFDESLVVCHRCDNPPCCNPTHLFLGSRADNNRDRSRKQRGRESRQWGDTNPSAKLTTEQVASIRQSYADGATQTELAKRFGVRQGSISRIIRGESRSKG